MFKLKHPIAGKPSVRRSPTLLCQACDQSPAAFLCKADDASLCAACDADIHSANPLARRHHRIPIQPSSIHFLTDDDDDEEAASWLLPTDQKNNASGVEMLLFGGVVDEYLDLDNYNNTTNNDTCQFGDEFGKLKDACPGEDSVVPIQGQRGKCEVPDQGFQLGLEYDASNGGYTFTTSSVSQNVSLSSIDVGIVPEASSIEAVNPHQRPPKGTIDLFTGCHVQMANQLSVEDREARVLRYREKKKNRKFEKTIRYASRKAYAEIRPRIKGRFAKRTEDGIGGVVGMNRMMLSESGMSETTAYGIVPSLF